MYEKFTNRLYLDLLRGCTALKFCAMSRKSVLTVSELETQYNEAWAEDTGEFKYIHITRHVGESNIIIVGQFVFVWYHEYFEIFQILDQVAFLAALKDLEEKFYYREVVKNLKFCKPLSSKWLSLKGAELHAIALNLLSLAHFLGGNTYWNSHPLERWLIAEYNRS